MLLSGWCVLKSRSRPRYTLKQKAERFGKRISDILNGKEVDERDVDRALQKATEVSGIENRFYTVEPLDYNLDTVARAENNYRSRKSTLRVGRDFYDLADPMQVRTMLHELVHCLDFEGRLVKKIRDDYGLPELASEVEDSKESRTNILTGEKVEKTPEGMVDFLTVKLTGNKAFEFQAYPAGFHLYRDRIERKEVKTEELSRKNGKLQTVFWPSEVDSYLPGRQFFGASSVNAWSRVVAAKEDTNIFVADAKERLIEGYNKQSEYYWEEMVENLSR